MDPRSHKCLSNCLDLGNAMLLARETNHQSPWFKRTHRQRWAGMEHHGLIIPDLHVSSCIYFWGPWRHRWLNHHQLQSPNHQEGDPKLLRFKELGVCDRLWVAHKGTPNERWRRAGKTLQHTHTQRERNRGILEVLAWLHVQFCLLLHGHLTRNCHNKWDLSIAKKSHSFGIPEFSQMFKNMQKEPLNISQSQALLPKSRPGTPGPFV